jgi:hypothetical protein
MERQQPSVGRTVHYVANGTPRGEFPAGVCRAAIITEVDSFSGGVAKVSVGLCVLDPSGLFFSRSVPYDAANAPGSWHWPERT